MTLYRLRPDAGPHYGQDGKPVQGRLVESDLPLDKKFANKFDRVDPEEYEKVKVHQDKTPAAGGVLIGGEAIRRPQAPEDRTPAHTEQYPHPMEDPDLRPTSRSGLELKPKGQQGTPEEAAESRRKEENERREYHDELREHGVRKAKKTAKAEEQEERKSSKKSSKSGKKSSKKSGQTHDVSHEFPAAADKKVLVRRDKKGYHVSRKTGGPSLNKKALTEDEVGDFIKEL